MRVGKFLVLILVLAVIASTAVFALASCTPEVDMSGVKFESQSFVYDGTEHELVISGTLPEGVSVTYENNKLTDVGSIEAVAHFTHENEKVTIPDMKATLTVTKAEGDVGEISFEDKTVAYDGTEHELVISGTLPEGVAVTYTANKLTMPGTIEVTASFTSDNPNLTYESMTATLTVTKAVINEADVQLVEDSFVYDGMEHSVDVVLPEYINYTLVNSKATDAGNYTCLILFDEATVDSQPIARSWTIEKAEFSNDVLEHIVFADASYTYDGSEHSLALSGADALPEGSTVSYSANNSLTKPGSVEVTATIRNKNYNDKTFTATLSVNRAQIDMSGVLFEGTQTEYDGTAKSVAATQLPENVEASYSGNNQINVGSYEVIVTYSVKENADCYSLSKRSDTVTLTITHKTVTITTVEELQAINDTIAASANYKYELGNNIDGSLAVDQENLVDGKYRWKGIGSWATPFKASFDGNGYTISNLYIDKDSGVFEAGQYFIGIFNVVASDDGLWIENLKVSDIAVDIDAADSTVTVGILAGRNGQGSIGMRAKDITVSDSTINIIATRAMAGNVFGYAIGVGNEAFSSIKCENVDMTANLSTAQIGGIVGYLEVNKHIYRNCSVDEQSSMNITVASASGTVQIGGLAGYLYGGCLELQIYDCSSAAQISVDLPEEYAGSFYAGKILGYAAKDGGDVIGVTYITVNFDAATLSSNMEKFGWTGSFKVDEVEKEDLVYYTATNGAFAESNAPVSDSQA